MKSKRRPSAAGSALSDSHVIPCVWDGEAFRPRGHAHAARCRERYGVGEVVMIEAQAERSWRSHNHQFAEIRDLWASLPESLSEAPYAVSPDALRKHALIATGHCDVETIDAGNKAAAERVAAYVGALATKAHGYSIVRTEGPIVRCWTPQSQSVRAMGGKAFQKSKTDVLEWIERRFAE